VSRDAGTVLQNPPLSRARQTSPIQRYRLRNQLPVPLAPQVQGLEFGWQRFRDFKRSPKSWE
jgi:hypothetical protein